MKTHKKSFSAQKSKGFLTCPRCKSKLEKIPVRVAGAKNKAVIYQCKCGYFSFEDESAKKVLTELKETPLKIKQKIVKISGNRLGMYFNKHVVDSLNLKKGEEILISVPDKKHVVVELS